MSLVKTEALAKLDDEATQKFWAFQKSINRLLSTARSFGDACAVLGLDPDNSMIDRLIAWAGWWRRRKSSLLNQEPKSQRIKAAVVFSCCCCKRREDSTADR